MFRKENKLLILDQLRRHRKFWIEVLASLQDAGFLPSRPVVR
jgi:hypothetical protein